MVAVNREMNHVRARQKSGGRNDEARATHLGKGYHGGGCYLSGMGPVLCALALFASPPQELGTKLAREVADAAREHGARRVHVDVKAVPDLVGAPALLDIAAAIEAELGGRLAAPGEPADLDVVAELARVRGRIALGGPVVKGGATRDWVLASVEETPGWWAWLSPVGASSVDASGFAWGRVGNLDGEVRDADAGDLDGDGRVEIAAATRDELVVFAVRATGVAEIARAPLGAIPPAEVATRAPRTFVRIVNTGSPEIHVRASDERKTRVFGWEGGRLVRRAERDPIVLATRPGGREPVIGELAPGTNAFAEAPKLRRGSGGEPLASTGGPWIDARAADLSALEQLGTTGPAWGLLDATGNLRLLRSDFAETSRIAHTGAAFAIADFDADGSADALVSRDGPADAADRVTLVSGAITKWSAETDGPVAAIAAGPTTEAGVAALVFVRAAETTEVWLLRKPR